MKESTLQNAIRNALVGEGLFFRANVGQAWTGSKVEKLAGNRVLIHDARPFSTGLPAGFADIFGARSVLITPEMIGQELAVFTALEVKTETGRVSENQANFLSAIKRVGGRAGVVRSTTDALKIVKGEQ